MKKLGKYIFQKNFETMDSESTYSKIKYKNRNEMNRFENFIVIATFSVGPNNVSELRHFLQRAWNNSNFSPNHHYNSDASMPKVIILDNLHHAGKLEAVFEGLKLPSSSSETSLQNRRTDVQYIIGTMNSTSLNAATSPTNGFQMSHNFRWLVCSAYTEPARGVLGRCLRQRLIFIETRTRSHDGEMALVI